MYFTKATVAAAGFVAFAAAAALPQNAGNGGDGPTNVCDARGTPEVFDLPNHLGPRVDSCVHLSELFRSKSLFGEQTTITDVQRSWTSGDCTFLASAPVFEPGVEYKVGSDDLADLVDSAIEDFRSYGGTVGIMNTKRFVVDGEYNVVACETANEDRTRLINVKYAITGRVSGKTLPSESTKSSKSSKSKSNQGTEGSEH